MTPSVVLRRYSASIAPMRAFLCTVSFAVLVVTLAACSGTRPTVPGGPSAGPDETPATYPAYETFDASPYDAQPPGRVEIVHDVPAVVMAGRVVVPSNAGVPAPTEPVARQVDGYRIQVFSSANRASAEQTRAAAVAWWSARSGARARRASSRRPWSTSSRTTASASARSRARRRPTPRSSLSAPSIPRRSSSRTSLPSSSRADLSERCLARLYLALSSCARLRISGCWGIEGKGRF